jgi:hypothetical protein
MLHHHKPHEGAFNSEEVRILGAAFDEAWKAIQDSGAVFAQDGQAEAMREVIARRIIATASLGERERHRLRDDALLYLARKSCRVATRTEDIQCSSQAT